MNDYPKAYLKKGRDKSARQRHPWIFSGAIATLPNLTPGSIVDLHSNENQFIARGYVNSNSQIQIRLLTWESEERIDAAFWKNRLATSIAARQDLLKAQTSCRLVFGEADRLPGLIVDCYSKILVLQALTAGIDAHLEVIVQALKELFPDKAILERSDEAVRELEGVAMRNRLLHGEVPKEIEIVENGLHFLIDPHQGHKSGFYLDQRINRRKVEQLVTTLPEQRRILNCFSYTGGFGLAAARGGATAVDDIDSSASALNLAKKNWQLNDLSDHCDYQATEGDVFEVLRQLRNQKAKYDLIVLDPPKLAFNRQQIDKACRAYKDLNLIALQLLEKNGYLVTFSCSGLISADLFQKVVFGAALDAKVDAQIIDYLHQADDHPVLLTFPEAAYLKGLVCRKISA
jgi:23S rRNA (cytosine1962-C5)-methyltransferase